MKEIKPIGSTFQIDSKGYLVNPTSNGKLKEPWNSCIEEIKDTCTRNLGKNLHSMYIRGSVAKGEAIPNVSDLDGFVVVHKKTKDHRWILPFKEKLIKKYKTIPKIELPITSLNEVQGSYNQKFLIETQSLCIYGEDLAKTIQGFRPGKELAKKQNSYLMNNEIAKTKETIEHLTLEKTKAKCVWIMKRILRTAFLLVLEKERTFTKDLYPSYKLFAKHYPKKEQEMKQVLEWAIFPTYNRKEIINTLDGIGMFIEKEAKEKLT